MMEVQEFKGVQLRCVEENAPNAEIKKTASSLMRLVLV